MPRKPDVVTVASDSSSHTDSTEHELVYYPAFCNNASPTWFTWVKLTAHDVHHRLTMRQSALGPPTFTGPAYSPNTQLPLFYLNHPIQFVQLVGVVVTFEDYYEKFWLFTVDDSSGATIEVNCKKPRKHEGDAGGEEAPGQVEDVEANARHEALSRLDIGVVVQVKGRVSMFREIRQLQLERITVIRETNQEMRLVDTRDEFKRTVLCRPWQLSKAKQKRMHEHALGESETEHKRSRTRQTKLKLKADQERRHTLRLVKRYEQEEKKRQAGAEEARAAGLLLLRNDLYTPS